MAIEHAIWKIGGQPEKLQPARMENEDLLEELIFKDVSILDDGWMLIGRQVRTDYDKRIDLLAVDAAGSLIIIELKRHKTPRDVVAQALDYASWVTNLEEEVLPAFIVTSASSGICPISVWTKHSCRTLASGLTKMN